MPAINVARTDTFEQQRNKINDIGSQVFNIAAGGSDLSTGNLKLGDGSKNVPSLSFISDNSLGLFKSDLNVLSFVSGSRKIFEYSSSQVSAYNDLYVIKNELDTAGTIIASGGSGYGSGTYTAVPLTGGSGSGSESTLVVEAFLGSVTTNASGLASGQYFNVTLTGGSAPQNSTLVNFTVPDIVGSISNAGSGYVENSYDDVSLTGGNGSGAVATVVVDNTGYVTEVTISQSGSGYLNGDVLSPDTSTMTYIDENDITQTSGGSGATYVISNDPSSIDTSTLIFTSKGDGYLVGEVLSLKPEVTGVTLTIATEEGEPSSTVTITEAQYNQFVNGSTITKTGGTAVLAANTTITLSIDGDSGAYVLALSDTPTTAGSITVTITPPYGEPATNLQYTISSLGSVGSVTITNGGVGYAVGDVLSTNPSNLIQSISYAATSIQVQTLTFNPAISLGALTTSDQVQVQGGAIEDTEVTTASTGGTANGSVSNVAPTSTSGNGIGGLFDVSFDENGVVLAVNISFSDYGYNYQANDTVTLSGASIGASGNTVVTVTGVSSDGALVDVLEVIDDGSNITSVVVADGGSFQDTSLVKDNTNVYPLSAVGSENRYQIDGVTTPDLTFFVGDTIEITYPGDHPFTLSAFRDGIYAPSLVSSISGSVTAGSAVMTLNSSTGILPGMLVNATGAGAIPSSLVVISVDGPTQITLSGNATATGALTANFSGGEYTEGVTRVGTVLSITISENTPTTLYYYCTNHPNMGGGDNQEASITIDSNNPRTFGSGLVFNVSSITSTNVFNTEVETSTVSIPTLVSSQVNTVNQALTGTLTAVSIVATDIDVPEINSATDIVVTAVDSLTLSSTDIAFKDKITVDTDGNIDSAGYFKTSSYAEFNEKLHLEEDTISSKAGFDINIIPAVDQVVKIPTTTSLNIPFGTTAERPTLLAENGSIRFNTESQQYEGYNATTTAWSSLGGVRDQDGNTYIKAEETVGANDNTLYFINDDINTINVTPNSLEFVNVKTQSSVNTSAPNFVNWNANTPVTAGTYLKWKNNLYEVQVGGTTGGPGSPPVDTTGSTFLNGNATLIYSQLAVGPIVFEDVEEVRIDPTGSSPIVINNELKLSENVISSVISDILISPNSGKKVKINTNTTLVLPSGADADRGSPDQGSVRFNTSALQFEGYDGVNWGSLGGVKDVDQNTYIIPELSPGSNENILYFYNDNNNTLRLTATALDFDTVDIVRSVTSNEFELTSSLLTLDNASTTIDNTDTTKTFIHSNKTALELGLSSGLNVDPILRFQDTGDIFYNIGFGTGTYDGVKIFDSELKEFELADYIISTKKITLVKGSAEIGSAVLYSTVTANGCRCTILSKNTSTGDKSMVEYGIINKSNTDIYNNEYGGLNSSQDGFTTTFDFTDENEVRATVTLTADHLVGSSVEFTVVTHALK